MIGLPASIGVAMAVTAMAWSPVMAAEDGCYPDWSQAAPIVKAEKLVTVEELSAAARAHLGGDIVKTTLCREKDGYVFRLVVRDAKGQLRALSVDARNPFGR